MKKVVLFQLIVLLFACNQSSDNTPDNDTSNSDTSKESTLEPKAEEEPFQEDEVVSDIKKKFEDINQNTASYKMESSEMMDESTEGGELKAYYQDEDLKKVVASYFGEMGKSVEEYYYSEGNTFFVFTQQYSYDKPITVEGSAVTQIEENRYYLHKSKLVRWIGSNKEKVANSSFSQKEPEILQKIKDVKKKLGTSQGSDDDVDMKALFSLTPLSIFDETTEGLSLSEKTDLLKKGASDSWEIADEHKTKLTLQSNDPSSKVTLHFLKNKANADGVLFAEVANGDNNSIHSWRYLNEGNSLQKASILKEYSANDFVSKEDKLPDTYEPILYHHFIDDQTIEVSLHTWMDKAFENREVINRILLKWNGESFEETIEKI